MTPREAAEDAAADKRPKHTAGYREFFPKTVLSFKNRNPPGELQNFRISTLRPHIVHHL